MELNRARVSRARFAPALALALLILPLAAEAATLRGSRSSLLRQQRIAREHDYTHLRNAAHVSRFVRSGYLVPVRQTPALRLHSVSYPYARPEVKLFLEKLAGEYRAGCGEPLVVTSLTRPASQQPQNASPFSVHPTGMAVDLRKSRSSACQRWIEGYLLSLERAGVLDATEEHRPPHYHIALYPAPYARFLAQGGFPKAGAKVHRVERGDTLWDIASRFGTTVAAIKKANGMRGTTIRPGQVLRVP